MYSNSIVQKNCSFWIYSKILSIWNYSNIRKNFESLTVINTGFVDYLGTFSYCLHESPRSRTRGAFQSELISAILYPLTFNSTVQKERLPGRVDWELVAQQHLHNMSDQLFVAFEKYFLTSNEVSFLL